MRRLRRRAEQFFFRLLMRLSLFLVIAGLGVIVFSIVDKGIQALSWEMISQTPQGGFYLGGGGGILNAIVGSLYLALGATILGLILSLPVVFYLQVYAPPHIAELIRLSLDVLWGVPSIVYGIFIFTLMLFFGWQVSLLGGIIALALLETPILTRGMDEVLKMVPHDLTESIYAMGLTRFETMMILFRQTLPGMVTVTLLGIGRAIGDAASVLFTAGYTDHMPESLMQPVASLPLAVFFQIGSPFPKVQARAYASALILVAILLCISIAARLSSRVLAFYVVR